MEQYNSTIKREGKVGTKDILNNQHGFSLIGALIGLAIFVIGILAMFTLQGASSSSVGKSMRYTQANSWAQDAAESLLSAPFDDPAMDPPYAVGAPIDPLEPIGSGAAGGLLHSETQGPYTIKWVVFTSDNNVAGSNKINDFALISNDPMFDNIDKSQAITDIPANTKVISLQVSHPNGQTSHLVFIKANV